LDIAHACAVNVAGGIGIEVGVAVIEVHQWLGSRRLRRRDMPLCQRTSERSVAVRAGVGQLVRSDCVFD
jgi:hypothetical protein